MNEYTDIAKYYDLLMSSGYYDYGTLAKSVDSVVSADQRIIEIGVGTGLLLEKLLEINPDYKLSGMDHTVEMLDIAKERLGDRCELFQADVVAFSVPSPFDVAISNGGVGAFVDDEGGCDLYTHLIDDESNLKAFRNIANCLTTGGLFVINVQGVHSTYDKHLTDGVVYSQKIVESAQHPDCIEKTFLFTRGDEVLVQQQLIYRIFRGEAIDKLFQEAGFKFKDKDETGKLFLYEKKS